MKLIAISQAELDVLFDQTAYVYRLYIVLRARMDKATGVVGRASRISLTALSEELEERPDTRSKPWRPSKSAVRRMLSRLERLGMAENVSEDAESLVFRLPMAVLPQSVSNKGGARPTQHAITEADTQGEPLSASNGGASSGEADTQGGAMGGAPAWHQADTHQVSSITSPNGEGPSGPDEGNRRVWRLWCELVGDTPANRRILGKCIKDHGEEQVTEAVLSTYAKAPADPVAYLRGCLRERPRIVV